jgi:peptidyl-prolyl cis-trans isomerase SurA
LKASSTKAFKVIVNVKTKLSDCLRPLMLGALLLSGAVHAAVQPLDSVVAIVDNDVIMKSQMDQRVHEVQQTIAKRGGGTPPAEALQSQVLDRLILENLQLQIGERSGIRITDEELNQAIGTIAQRNNMSLEQFRAALAHDGVSYNDAREQVRREMIISRVRQRRVAERIQVSEQEVKNFLASDLGKAQLSEEFHLANILIPTPDSASSDAIQAAARQAQDIYGQLKKGADFAQMAIAKSASESALEGGDMGWRKAAQLPPAFGEMLASMPVGDVTPPARTPGGFIILKLLEKRGGQGQAQMRDEVHVRHILIKPSEIRSEEETRRLAQKLYERIENGEDFSELAKSFSEDPGSALNGGDLNWVDPASLVPEFRDVMNETPQGELSRPFKTAYGWHVLEVLGRRATDATSQARDQQALNVLRNRKYDEELQTWLRQIRDEAYVEIKLPGAAQAAQ